MADQIEHDYAVEILRAQQSGDNDKAMELAIGLAQYRLHLKGLPDGPDA